MFHRRRAALSAAACALALSTGFAADAETLADAVALAYQTNPTLQAQRAQLRAIDENYVQARTGFRPQADASVSSAVTYSNANTFARDRTSETASITFGASQPLYTGGRVTAAVRAAEADILSGRQNLRVSEANVIFSVVQAYMDVLRDTEGLRIRQENASVLRRQLEEAQARFEVGEITRTDVAQAEARLAAAQASLAAGQAQIAVSRAAFTAAVGQSPAELAPEPTLPNLPATLEQAFQIAEAANPAILAARYGEQAAEARVRSARAEYSPSASLRANAQTQGSIAEFRFDERNFSETASLTAVVSVPLFSGGLNASRVRQALERENVARIQVEGQRRQVRQNVTQSWNQMLAARAQYVANQEQVRAARIAFEGAQQEAQVGLRTTLDVLNAQQELRNAELALVQARRDEYVASAGLLASMGLLEAKNLVEGVETYDPERSFQQRRDIGRVPVVERLAERLDAIESPTAERPRAAEDLPIPVPAVLAPPIWKQSLVDPKPATVPLTTRPAPLTGTPVPNPGSGPVTSRPLPGVGSTPGGRPPVTSTPVPNPGSGAEPTRPAPARSTAPPPPGTPGARAPVTSKPVPNPTDD